MKDTEKNASESVIEGEATIRPGRKKMSSKGSVDKKAAEKSKQSRSDTIGNPDKNMNSDYKSVKIKHSFLPFRKLFSLKNLSWILAFIISIFAVWMWIWGNIFISSEEIQKLSSILDETRERLVVSEQQLAQTQKRMAILEKELVMLTDNKTRDDRLGTISSELRELEFMFEKLNKKQNPTQLDTFKTTNKISLETEKISFFLDSLWFDSQTGRDLNRYLPLIERLKATHVNNNTFTSYFNSVDIALGGNLSSHNNLLFELNRFLEKDSEQIKKSKNMLSFNQISDETEADIIVTSEPYDLSWRQYFAGLVKLRKISEENSSSKFEENPNQDQSRKLEKKLPNQAYFEDSQPIESLQQAISYITALVNESDTGFNSEQLKTLNQYLTQIKSRNRVDKMIDDIHKAKGKTL